MKIHHWAARDQSRRRKWYNDDIWFVWLSVAQFQKALDMAILKNDNLTILCSRGVCGLFFRHMNKNILMVIVSVSDGREN